MTFTTEFKITNNTENMIILNFNSFISNKLANFVSGTIDPYSSVNIYFNNGIFYCNGIEMKKYVIIQTDKYLYGNLLLSALSDKNSIYTHDNLKWFDLKSIVISSNGLDLTDQLNIDPKLKFKWTKTDTIIASVIAFLLAIGIVAAALYLLPFEFIGALEVLLEGVGLTLSEETFGFGDETVYIISRGSVEIFRFTL